MNTERFAPAGWVWVCHACGKTHTDQYGIEGSGDRGWDESCMLNSKCYPIDLLVYNEHGKVKAIIKGESDGGA